MSGWVSGGTTSRLPSPMSDPNLPESNPNPVPPNAGSPPASAPLTSLPAVSPSSVRGWEVACHLAGFSGYLTGVGWILGPLIVWLLKRSEIPSVDAHGKEALNFQISVLIYALALVLVALVTCGVGGILLIALGVAQIVLMIIGGFKAANGELYRYPLTLRLIK